MLLKTENVSKNYQILSIMLITILISMVSGIHRFLISLLSNLLTASSENNIYTFIDKPAPLLLWLTLAFTIAPFGLTKAIADYYSGSMNKRGRF